MPTETPAAEGTPTSAAPPAFDEKAFKAGLDARLRGEAPADEAPPADTDEQPAKEDAAAAAVDEDTPADDAPEDGDGEGEGGEGEGGEDDDDPVDKEALRKLQKERRSFDKVKAETFALQRTVTQRAQVIERAEGELKQFVGELNTKPVQTLLKHGLIPDEDLAYWARQFHLLSPEGLKDPRSRPEAERLQRERERDRDAARSAARVAKLEEERAAEKAQLELDRNTNAYVARIEQSVPALKAKTPLLQKAMAADAGETKREIYSIAYELAQANGGQFVDPAKVLVAWEKRQSALLKRLGLATAPAPAAAPSKEKTPTAAKNQGQSQKKEGAPAAKEPAKDPDIASSEEEFQAGLRARLARK